MFFRLLVGLRWWSEIQDDGSEKWLFESKTNNFNPNNVDSAFFWTAQIAGSGVWVFFLALNILSFTPYWVTFIYNLMKEKIKDFKKFKRLLLMVWAFCFVGLILWGFTNAEEVISLNFFFFLNFFEFFFLDIFLLMNFFSDFFF